MSAAATIVPVYREAFELTKAEIKALCAFASRDLTRPHLCCVHFDTQAGVAVATDGHTLVMRRGVHPIAGASFNVKAATLLKRVSTADELAITAVDADEHEAVFPPYTQVIPATPYAKRAPSVGFNVDYLARLQLVAKAAELYGRGKKPYKPNALMSIGGELDPAKFEIDSAVRGCAWTVVIMPVRL